MLVIIKRMLFGILFIIPILIIVTIILYFPVIILGILSIVFIYCCGAMVDQELTLRKRDKLVPHG